MTEAAASFRDPAGSCRVIGQRVLRGLAPDSAAQVEAFLQTPSGRRLTEHGQLVSTRRLDQRELASMRESAGWPARFVGGSPRVFFEHERIPFQTYPYEWPPEMLWAAGQLTLETAHASLADGYGLKDATPYNILFRGPEPVFIDVPSFELREPGDPFWRPYAQFVRTFLLPLLANRRWGIRLADVFATRRDGLEPEEVYRLCGPVERFSPRVLSLVSMPTWLRGRARAKGEQIYEARTLSDTEKARFILRSLLNRLQRVLNSLSPRILKQSVWSGYMACNSYSAPAFAAKEQFVSSLLQELKPRRVLDVGANTGHFSLLAARAGAEVIAIDSDPVCVGALWRSARDQHLNVLPIVVDLARPSPALGWCNRECPSFLERAASSFDCVLMLAVIHHLLVTERIPLEEVFRLAAALTTDVLVVEFVAPDDDMFRQLVRGRAHLHSSLTEAAFEAACGAHFEILRSLPLPGTHRRLYALKRKGGSL
jgi:2-polyprenyl-3-methyl-5-hydroxy-6-metoxy-1,4-benzoquinol methylase